MNWIINISEATPLIRPVATPAPPAAAARPVVRAVGRDTFEFSIAALTRAVERSSLRIAKTEAIRAEIDVNTFETPERIEGTVTRLLDVIG